MQNSSEHLSAQTSPSEEEKAKPLSDPQIARTHATESQETLRIQLERQMTELEQEKQLLSERTRQVELSAAISHALISKLKQQELFQYCCNAILQYLNVNLVCIWTLESRESAPQLRSYAGDAFCMQEQETRATLERIFKEKASVSQQPYTITLIPEQTEDGQNFLARQGFTTFADYSLIFEDEVLGILGVFSRHPFDYATSQTLVATANAIAIGIAHRRNDQEREHLLVLAQNARLMAEHALEARKSFLSSVIHDLKSPLTSIIGSAQLLQRRIEKHQPPESEKYLQTIEVITASTRRMADMIGDLLDLARIQMGLKLELNQAEGDLLQLIQRVVAEHQQTTTKHLLTIQTNCDCLPMSYDAPHLERMLTNLLSNAIKYSPNGGEINIIISRQETTEGTTRVTLCLQDHGIGIPAQDLPHIFEPFHRATNSEHNFQGTGLGLSSASQIIEQHGGTITVASEEDQGTTFTISLPCVSVEMHEH